MLSSFVVGAYNGSSEMRSVEICGFLVWDYDFLLREGDFVVEGWFIRDCFWAVLTNGLFE